MWIENNSKPRSQMMYVCTIKATYEYEFIIFDLDRSLFPFLKTLIKYFDKKVYLIFNLYLQSRVKIALSSDYYYNLFIYFLSSMTNKWCEVDKYYVKSATSMKIYCSKKLLSFWWKKKIVKLEIYGVASSNRYPGCIYTDGCTQREKKIRATKKEEKRRKRGKDLHIDIWVFRWLKLHKFSKLHSE